MKKWMTVLGLACALGVTACGDGTEEAGGKSAEKTPVTVYDSPKTVSQIPDGFVSYWDALEGDEAPCSNPSEMMIEVKADAIQFYESGFSPDKMVMPASNRIELSGEWFGIEESGKETYVLELNETGDQLVFESEGFEPTTYRKCDFVATFIPDEFQGSWAVFDTCERAGKDLMVIEPTQVVSRDGTRRFTKVEYVGTNAVEIEDEGQDEPWGITLSNDRNSGALVGPGHSPIPITRC